MDTSFSQNPFGQKKSRGFASRLDPQISCGFWKVSCFGGGRRLTTQKNNERCFRFFFGKKSWESKGAHTPMPPKKTQKIEGLKGLYYETVI